MPPTTHSLRATSWSISTIRSARRCSTRCWPIWCRRAGTATSSCCTIRRSSARRSTRTLRSSRSAILASAWCTGCGVDRRACGPRGAPGRLGGATKRGHEALARGCFLDARRRPRTVNGKVRTQDGDRTDPGKPTIALPTGTVTFLFTDVEGSTELWERHHDAMRDALADHDAMLRDAVEAHRGAVFKTVGDAVCAAFLRPEDALAGALEAQRRLADYSWPAPIDRLRVRMAIHTGSAVETDGDYF